MKYDKPREKMLYGSVKDLTDQELLEVLLGSGTKNSPVDKLSEDVLGFLNYKLYELEGLRPEELCKIEGIKTAKACLLIAATELGVRAALSRAESRLCLSSPEDVKELFISEMRSLSHEEFHVVMLNAKLEVIGREKTSSGGIASACADPAKVFSQPIKRGCRAIIVAHNHPTGDPNPSESDIKTTTRLISSGKILGIDVLDHVIVGASDAFSFLEHGLINT